MELIKTNFEGLFIIEHRVLKDNRGSFIKTYNQEIFNNLGLNIEIKERYFSVSNKNVIRGMHFQIPPQDHIKLVTVLAGKIIDVVLDIRKNSKTYGEYLSFEISALEGKTIYIPKGFAHGFKSIIDNTIVEYNQTSVYSPIHDAGINYDTFGYNWDSNCPIVSERDKSFKSFNEFESPF